MGKFSPYSYVQTRAKLMKNYHEIPLHSSNNEQVLASKHQEPCQGAGKYQSCWAAGSRRCFCHHSSSLSRSARDKSPSSCVFKPSARNECPEKTDGDFTLSLLEEFLSTMSRGMEQAPCVCWLSSRGGTWGGCWGLLLTHQSLSGLSLDSILPI